MASVTEQNDMTSNERRLHPYSEQRVPKGFGFGCAGSIQKHEIEKTGNIVAKIGVRSCYMFEFSCFGPSRKKLSFVKKPSKRQAGLRNVPGLL